MKTFKDLVFQPTNDYRAGIQAHIYFPNGFGASVIRHIFSYGNEENLYELAVLDKSNHLCYTTEVTNDVLGYLTEDDVTDALIKIQYIKTDEDLKFY